MPTGHSGKTAATPYRSRTKRLSAPRHISIPSRKHDLIAANDEEDIIIMDVKPGQQDPFHAVQVMIYLYAVPNLFPTALVILAPSITRPLLHENQQSRYYPARLIPTFTSQRNNKIPIIIPCATEHLGVTQ